MKINWKIVAGLFAAGLLYDGIVDGLNRRRFAKLHKEHRDLLEILNIYSRKLQQTPGITFDEFDTLIMNQYIAERK